MLSASEDPIHPPDANGMDNPIHEAPWRRQGPYASRKPRPPVRGDRDLELALEARREADEDAWGDREVW